MIAIPSGDGMAFCTLLGSIKASDRVNLCKLFRDLIKHELPSTTFAS